MVLLFNVFSYIVNYIIIVVESVMILNCDTLVSYSLRLSRFVIRCILARKTIWPRFLQRTSARSRRPDGRISFDVILVEDGFSQVFINT